MVARLPAPHSRQGLVIPQSAPEASGEAGTLVLAPERNIPEPPTFLLTPRFLATQESRGFWIFG